MTEAEKDALIIDLRSQVEQQDSLFRELRRLLTLLKSQTNELVDGLHKLSIEQKAKLAEFTKSA